MLNLEAIFDEPPAAVGIESPAPEQAEPGAANMDDEYSGEDFAFDLRNEFNWRNLTTADRGYLLGPRSWRTLAAAIAARRAETAGVPLEIAKGNPSVSV